MSRDLYRTLHSAFDIFNRTNEKAYNITVSTGFYLLPKDMDSTLPEMLAHADAMLYEEKQKRDKNVAKIYQNRFLMIFSGKQLEYLRDDF